MSSYLVDVLKSMEDFRAPRGRRYPLWLILLLAILGTLNGYRGYKALEDFSIRHCGTVCEYLGISLKRLPSDSTFRQLFEHLEFEDLSQAFAAWLVAQDSSLGQDGRIGDDQGMSRPLCDCDETYQNFVDLISAYSNQSGIVAALQQFENRAASETAVVRMLLEHFDGTEAVFP